MPGRSMAGRESLKLVTSVRPPQHTHKQESRVLGTRFDSLPGSQICCVLKVRGVVKATVTSLSKKHRC